MPTNPGINKNFDESHYTRSQFQVIEAFSQYFYVTRPLRSVQIANSKYTAFLMRPTDEMSIALNVEREFVVLFADYDTFEIRTLQSFESFDQQVDDLRIDKSIRFVVSADRDIEKHIRHFLLQEPEFPIVIPFQFKDFASFSAGLIMSAVRKNYLIRDLFGYESPLRQDYFFFGRSKIVEDVIDRHRAGQNSSLFGLRKSGKTSTIYAIQRRAKTNGIRPILIDCQDPNIHARTYVKLLQFIIEMVRSELSLKKISVDLGDQPDKVSSEFKRLMSQTLGEAGIGVLLIFDEIENISPRTAASPHWRNERDTLLFWQTLRTFFHAQSNFDVGVAEPLYRFFSRFSRFSCAIELPFR